MTGIIWLVQCLVYPIFRYVGEKEFTDIHNFQMKRISILVGPLMTLEFFTAALLLYQIKTSIYFFNLLSVIILWGLTFLVNIRAHENLNYRSQSSKKNLVAKNWPRTILWSLRSLFLAYIVLKG
jgi:hypothetical protein